MIVAWSRFQIGVPVTLQYRLSTLVLTLRCRRAFTLQRRTFWRRWKLRISPRTVRILALPLLQYLRDRAATARLLS